MLDLIFGLLPLDIPPPSSPSAGAPGTPAGPIRSSGFAAMIGGFFALGLIILAGLLISLKPKRLNPGGSGGIPPGLDTDPGNSPGPSD